jgi:hypothetical protein
MGRFIGRMKQGHKTMTSFQPAEDVQLFTSKPLRVNRRPQVTEIRAESLLHDWVLSSYPPDAGFAPIQGGI